MADHNADEGLDESSRKIGFVILGAIIFGVGVFLGAGLVLAVKQR